MAITNAIPKWQEELNSFTGITSTFILEGNINDKYPLWLEDGRLRFAPMKKILESIFGGYNLLFGDPLFGFTVPEGADEQTKELAKQYEKSAKSQRRAIELFYEEKSYSQMRLFSEAVRAALTESAKSPIAAVVNFASRLVRQSEQQDPDETAMYLNFMYASQNAKRTGGYIHTLILVVDKRGDVPSWFSANNPNVRTITIPNPDREAREYFINAHFAQLQPHDELKQKFISMTEGLKLLNLDELRRLYEKSGLPVEKITDTVSMFKYGLKENKWEMMRNRLTQDIAAALRERVKGQDKAIEKIERIIKRAVTGLSGMQNASGADKPRGILFLAGPTGTGKTEVVKAVTELLFGDEKACIRFDMSEFGAEHADQKLFGAPPGYVGYAQGGQLTNAVKANPFSVLLFDEIEKAHPSIMDKFLQILEDGRMTDGQGNTVYFSQTLIFFTSNAGISKTVQDANGNEERVLLVQPGEEYDQIEQKVKNALKKAFKPEVLNRIGDNVVVFDYISEGATQLILEKQLAGVQKQMKNQNGIDMQIDAAAKAYLLSLCMSAETRSYGGRGIGNVVESCFLEPLAEYVFNQNIQRGGRVLVTRALLEGQA